MVVPLNPGAAGRGLPVDDVVAGRLVDVLAWRLVVVDDGPVLDDDGPVVLVWPAPTLVPVPLEAPPPAAVVATATDPDEPGSDESSVGDVEEAPLAAEVPAPASPVGCAAFEQPSVLSATTSNTTATPAATPRPAGPERR